MTEFVLARLRKYSATTKICIAVAFGVGYVAGIVTTIVVVVVNWN